MDDKLAEVTATRIWKIPPVIDLTRLEALPPAAKAREIKKAADTFASTGRNVFAHYMQPILHVRRDLLLASSTTKKKYAKTAAQLWPTLQTDEAFFWHEAAREIRQCLKQGLLSPKGCLIHAGRVGERENYVWHAEIAVAMYINLPSPQQPADTIITATKSDSAHDQEIHGQDSTLPTLEALSLKDFTMAKIATVDEECADDITSAQTIEPDGSKHYDVTDTVDANHELLDTLPDPFTYGQTMLYSHFAHYDYDAIFKAEGKHQTAMLRQLADRFDRTGKVLFYYYVVPRLCKQVSPPNSGDTVTSKAAELWRFLSGVEKDGWVSASAVLKKGLGDGDLGALETLRLESLDPAVLELHEFAQRAVGEDGG